MTTTDRPSTWRDVTADALAWVLDALASGDLDPADPDGVTRWVEETAGGCEHVIWYDNAYALWRDVTAPDWDTEVSPSTDPDALLGAYARHAVETALRQTIEALTGEDAPAWGPCTRCGLPVYVMEPERRGGERLTVEVRSGDDGGTYDWCNGAPEDHTHRKGTRA